MNFIPACCSRRTKPAIDAADSLTRSIGKGFGRLWSYVTRTSPVPETISSVIQTQLAEVLPSELVRIVTFYQDPLYDRINAIIPKLAINADYQAELRLLIKNFPSFDLTKLTDSNGILLDILDERQDVFSSSNTYKFIRAGLNCLYDDCLNHVPSINFVSDTIPPEYKTITFCGIACTWDLIELFTEELNESDLEFKSIFIDLCKKTIPSSWSTETIDLSKKLVTELKKEHKTDTEINNELLQRYEIYSLSTDTPEEAIENERKALFLAKEVIVDMDAPRMLFKPSAVYNLLASWQVH